MRTFEENSFGCELFLADIISGNACICVEKGCQGDEKLQSAKVPREGLGQLLKLAESRVNTGYQFFEPYLQAP